MNHQILSPYTAFVGVETTGPRIDASQSKVRHIPIQISKGDEHLFRPQFASYGFASSGVAYAPMPMSMNQMYQGGLSRNYGMPGPVMHKIQYAA